MQQRWIHFSFWGKNILTLSYGEAVLLLRKLEWVQHEIILIPSKHALSLLSRAGGRVGKVQLRWWLAALLFFIFFLLPSPILYILPTLHFSTSLCPFFFFKVHFETVVTSRSPRDGITSTEIKYTIWVSAQLSNVETQYKWQPRVVVINWLKNNQTCLGILARCLPNWGENSSGEMSSVLIWFYFHWHILVTAFWFLD